jgi:hypothetical protein
MSFGGGLSSLTEETASRENRATLQAAFGVGSPSSHPVVLGGIVKSMTYFSNGTDLIAAVRGANGAFARGGWGFAVDAGAYQRWWGLSSTGFAGALVLGAPYGIEAAFTFEDGRNGVRTYAGTLGVDLLRLTVYRTFGENYWPNPFPAARKEALESGGSGERF